MPTDATDALVETRRGYVEAAAGCGKTEAIAKAVARSAGRQLVLTHTHAGVRALRHRLRKFDVPESKFRIDTIAGWCLRYAVSFPGLSGIVANRPSQQDWSAIYPAVLRILATEPIHEIVLSSYAGLFVDEYQDCTTFQHKVIRQLAGLLPCRVLGDPLQAIFDFNAGDTLVDWTTDVMPFFEELPSLREPHRWAANRPLGRRLTDLRERLQAGESIDFRKPPFRWRELPSEIGEQTMRRAAVCGEMYGAEGTVVAIRRYPQGCYSLARKLQGRYTCMEEVDCTALFESAERIHRAHGIQRCAAVFQFADLCIVGLAAPLKTIRDAVERRETPDPQRLRKHREVAFATRNVAENDGLAHVSALLRSLLGVTGRHVTRRELLREMIRAVDICAFGRESLRDVAWELRSRQRRQGRSPARRVLSRTLLVKGLEFDHVVVMDTTEHNARNFYVAATRPRSTLTICASTPTHTFSLGREA